MNIPANKRSSITEQGNSLKTEVTNIVDDYYREFVIEIPIYKGNLIIMLTNDTSEVIARIMEWDDDKEIFAHSIYTDWEGTSGYVVLLNFHHDVPITPGVIAHEAFHITEFILQTKGLPLTEGSSEAYAYLIEWVTNQIYSCIKSLDK